jgi:hypothetical protein
MKIILMAITFLLFSQSALAITTSWNGFMSLVGGETLSGDANEENYLGQDCPCFIADYHEGGIYEYQKFSLENESRIGGQLNLGITDDFSFVTQLVAREGDLNISWAYFSWDFQPDWTLQIGRKRIPLYSKSEIQDVGFAYDWVRPPQPLYGWEVAGYNGINLRYTSQWQQWDLTTNVFYGDDEVKDSGYSRIYNLAKQDVRWKNIRGIELSATRDIYTLRWVYMASDNALTDKPFSNHYLPDVKQEVMGFALDMDLETWFILSELNVNHRNNSADEYKIKAPAIMLAIGKRWHDWTLLASSSRYWETSSNRDNYEPERFINSSLTLRYDVNASQAIKVQVDRLSDQSQFDFVGSTTVLSVAYDWVF